jgi:DNA-damage-inducible protein J
MSTAINMFIKQIIKTDGLPFEVKNTKPNKELLEALQEGEVILQEIKEGKRKGYSNMPDLIKSLNEE